MSEVVEILSGPLDGDFCVSKSNMRRSKRFEQAEACNQYGEAVTTTLEPEPVVLV